VNAGGFGLNSRVGISLVLVAAALSIGGAIQFNTVAPTAVVDQFHPDLIVGMRVHALAEVCSTTSLCPSTVRSAYNLTGLLSTSTTNGTGQSVVIVDACGDTKIATDLSTFDTRNGLPAPTLTVYHPQGAPCKNSGWSLETALDVEWAHVIAPAAKINLVVAARATTKDLYGAWTYALTNKLGNQISNSWGGTSSCGSTPTSILATAAKANVTILASSGDSGAWGSGQLLGAQAPADCAAVLTVGGTTLSVTGTGGYTSESAWSGSGGGYVPTTAEPSYQTTVKITDSYKELSLIHI